MVEAAGVELSRVLTARKLLIPGTPTRAKKAPLPDPLYVYCTKMLSPWSPAPTTRRPQYLHRFVGKQKNTLPTVPQLLLRLTAEGERKTDEMVESRALTKREVRDDLTKDLAVWVIF